MIVRCLGGMIFVVFGLSAFGQQIPFVPVTGPNAPQGASWLFEDKIRGGLWLGGMVQGSEGLIYFGGSRFILPLDDRFPKVSISGMAEDSEGGIWLATNEGIFRVSKGRLVCIAAGRADAGIVQAAADLFMAAVVRPGANNAELLKVGRGSHGWRVEVILPSTPSLRFQSDNAGNIFYVCPGGYCEIRGNDVANAHAGSVLATTGHSMPALTGFSSRDVAFRDRFGCVWMRSMTTLKYQCPAGTLNARADQVGIAGPGNEFISELPDGSMLIPSFGKLAVGRPGHFRVVTALSGYPGTLNAVISKDGSIWLSNSNGLFVFPTHLPIEFWTEREGLDGNTWSVLRTSDKTFAIAGNGLAVLNTDRTRWSSLPFGQDLERLYPGPGNTFFTEDTSHRMVELDDGGKLMRSIKPRLEESLPVSVRGDPQGGGGSWSCSAILELIRKGQGWNYPRANNDELEEWCRYLLVDNSGEIWAGSNGRLGTFILIQDPKGAKPAFQTFSSGGEIGNGTIRFLGVDSRGWLWRGSPVGVYVADTDEARQGRWLYLNHQDGIAGTDANRGSFFSDPDGSVWFGLDNSVNHLHPPSDFLHPSYAPEIFVSGYSLNGGDMKMADMVANIKSEDSITANISSLQYDRRNSLWLRYRLLPEQATWRDSRGLDLLLGTIPAGTHTLEVQGRIFTGPWSGTVSRSFRVLKPLWLTKPFLFSYTVGTILLVLAFEWLRRRRAWDERMLMPDLADWRMSALLPEGDELTGTKLDGRFEVGKLLAKGGFASVLVGYDGNERRLCAIKVFRGEVKNKASTLRGFEQEVASLRQIRHPNVVTVYADGFTSTGAPYLAMEFVEGKNLRDILKEGALPGYRVARLLRQLASALDAIHRCGICHRDLKPENVIVRQNGQEDEEAVLIDFSIAIIKDANETLYGLSRAAGTFDYMAPEQAMGHARPASDIFSLAKLTIEMLTGKRLTVLLPDAALDLPGRTPTLLAKYKLGLSAVSVKMLADALEFDPGKRPNVASEFAMPIARDLTANRNH